LRRLGKLWDETAQDILEEFFTLAPALFLGAGVDTPQLSLADTELEQLVCSVVNGEIEFVKENAISLAFLGSNQLGIPLTGQ
jgi:hypothetical protein